MTVSTDVLRLIPYNVLENAAQNGSVAVTSVNSLYPARRLYDRDFSSPFVTLSALPLTVTIDQGGTIRPVDFIALTRHNLANVDLSLEYSLDGGVYTAIGSWTPTSSATWTYMTFDSSTYPAAQFWRFKTLNPTIVQRIGELYLGARQQAEVYIQDEAPQTIDPNAVVVRSPAGHVYTAEKGDHLRAYNRQVAVLPTDTATWGNEQAIDTILDDIGHGKKAFFIIDERNHLRIVSAAGGYSKTPLVPTSVYALSLPMAEVAI